jgi:hypothetical protein
MDSNPMAFTRLLRSAKAAGEVWDRSLTPKSEANQSPTLNTRSLSDCTPVLLDRQARVDAEVHARKEVSRVLATTDWYHLSPLLTKMTRKFHTYNINTLGESRLFFALLGYFREYAGEFAIEVPQHSGTRSLKKGLVRLLAFLPDSCFREGRPDYVNQDLLVNTWNQKAVLLAVKNFLILKAEEKLAAAEVSNDQDQQTGYMSMTNCPSSSNSFDSSLGKDSACGRSPRSLRPSEQTTPSTTPGIAPSITPSISPSTTPVPVPIAGSSKRKRSESRTGIYTSILQSAQELDSLCREQDEQIKKLKSEARGPETMVRDVQFFETKIRTLGEEALDREHEVRKLDRKIEEMLKEHDAAITRLGQEKEALITAHGAEARRLVQENETLVLAHAAQAGSLRGDIEGERRRGNQLHGQVQTVEQERDAVKQGWKDEIASKEALKQMLIVSGAFKADSIKVAAKAIIGGKKVREAVADMYRGGEGNEGN